MIFTIIGWSGAGLLLWSFTNTTLLERWTPTSYQNLFANCLGALGIVVHGISEQFWPPVIVNLPWCVFSFLKIVIRKRNRI
jgi:hypothetical protein